VAVVGKLSVDDITAAPSAASATLATESGKRR
jgi:hypothetical protein